MIYLTEVILRLRARCPIFGRRVGGTASFEEATSANAQFATPHAFVVPIGEVADDPVGNAVAQRITETFAIIVTLNNSAQPEDGRGAHALDQLEIIKRELNNALLGWEPIQWAGTAPDIPVEIADLMPASRADWFRFQRSEHVGMNAGRLWHQFEYASHYYDGCPDGFGATERTKTTVTITDGTGQLYDPADLENEATAYIDTIYHGSTRWTAPNFVFDPATGIITTTTMPDDDYEVTWIYEPTYTVPQMVYAEYYPELLSQAGGDPDAITHEMYLLESELPPDATIESFFDADAVDISPQNVFGKTYKVAEDEE